MRLILKNIWSEIAIPNITTEKNLLQKYVTAHNAIAKISQKCALLSREKILQRMSYIVLVPNIWIYAKWNLISNSLTIFSFSWENLSHKINFSLLWLFWRGFEIDGYLYPLWQSLITKVQLFAKKVRCSHNTVKELRSARAEEGKEKCINPVIFRSAGALFKVKANSKFEIVLCGRRW